jgi:EAL domain-containing protein (putative c-di-GMP-specific phosphodiesterase class I)
MTAPFLKPDHHRFLSAIEQGEIIPFFQSKHTLHTGKIIGFEVLARWDHPERGILPPAAFYDAFHDPILAPKLTKALTAKSLEHYAVWKNDLGFSGRLSLNVTSHDLGAHNFAEHFLTKLAASTVDPADTTLEVTEHVVLGGESGAVYNALKTLRARGVQIALDDFGTGYGGLQHLRSWPVDRLKLDRTFISDIADAFADYAIVRALSQLAAELGMTVIAEGIETQEQLDVLKKIGVPFGQGYFFSKPIAADAIPAILNRYQTS